MLSARLLRKPRPGRLSRFFERGFLAVERVYERILGWSLGHRKSVVALGVASFCAAALSLRAVRSEFLPVEDQSEFNVVVKAPVGASLQKTQSILEEVRRRLADQPWIEYTFETIGADELERRNEGTLYVKMVDKKCERSGRSRP
jgi:HAE1 family hydrophobic/amphiphilic exporter-1